jgi:hypothetical protein
MVQNKVIGQKASEDDSEPWGTIAFVVKIPLVDMPALIDAVKQVPTAKIVYKRISAGRLRIVAEDGDGPRVGGGGSGRS